MKLSYLGPHAISGADFSFLIITMWVRNHNLGAPSMEEAFLGEVHLTYILVMFRSALVRTGGPPSDSIFKRLTPNNGQDMSLVLQYSNVTIS